MLPDFSSYPIQLEDLEYQRRAIAAVVGVLEGQVRNSFDNSNLFGIQANITDLTPAQIEENKRKIISENGIAEADAKLTQEKDICIEMETGTGKTLVYLRTIYELFQRYRLTKFIILVPHRVGFGLEGCAHQLFEESRGQKSPALGQRPVGNGLAGDLFHMLGQCASLGDHMEDRGGEHRIAQAIHPRQGSHVSSAIRQRQSTG
jgi:hypothetical protein